MGLSAKKAARILTYEHLVFGRHVFSGFNRYSPAELRYAVAQGLVAFFTWVKR